MKIEDYFNFAERIETLSDEINAIKRHIAERRCEMDIDKARTLLEKCRVAFPREKDARMSFVFLFVLKYGAPWDMKVPHKVADILGIILKKERTSICRDFRWAKARVIKDYEYRKALNELMV